MGNLSHFPDTRTISIKSYKMAGSLLAMALALVILVPLLVSAQLGNATGLPQIATRFRKYYDLPVTVCLASGTISLIFEGGPHPTLTPAYLDLLKTLRVPAAFFFAGQNINANTIAIVARAEVEGHVIGFTGYKYPISYTSLTPAQVTRELTMGSAAVAQARGGFAPTYFRFPGNEYTLADLSAVTVAGYVSVSTSLDAFDGAGGSASSSQSSNQQQQQQQQPAATGNQSDIYFVQWQQRLSPVAANARYIASAHDSAPVALSALRAIVNLAQERGYTFLRLDDCLEKDANTLKSGRKSNGLGTALLLNSGQRPGDDSSTKSAAGAALAFSVAPGAAVISLVVAITLSIF
ncbi:hypothetical protein BC828DRAFT_382836 [Blastocladiella britannica]|nr:hypothetical protein BC828DRAFT_382836 [Blastocladiella britannica]